MKFKFINFYFAFECSYDLLIISTALSLNPCSQFCVFSPEIVLLIFWRIESVLSALSLDWKLWTIGLTFLLSLHFLLHLKYKSISPIKVIMSPLVSRVYISILSSDLNHIDFLFQIDMTSKMNANTSSSIISIMLSLFVSNGLLLITYIVIAIWIHMKKEHLILLSISLSQTSTKALAYRLPMKMKI